MKTNHTIRTHAITWSTHTLIAFAICALPMTVWAGDTDVDRLEVLKIHDLIQTSTADPVDESNPYSLSVEVNDSSSVSTLITSASFTPPGGSSMSLTGADGEFEFEQSFVTQAAMDAVFANGNYNFTLQTTTAPATYSPSLNLGGDSYPIAPKLSNTNWLDGKLQIDPSVDFTFNWNGIGNFDIAFGTEDNEVFETSLVTSSILPGGTLLPNRDYIATISFGTNSAIQDGPTNLNPAYDTITRFTIRTSLGPSIPVTITKTGTTTYELNWAPQPGILYDLETTTNLVNWTTVQSNLSFAVTPASTGVTTGAGDSRRFWRFKVVP